LLSYGVVALCKGHQTADAAGGQRDEDIASIIRTLNKIQRKMNNGRPGAVPGKGSGELKARFQFCCVCLAGFASGFDELL
jgi:hypothetical protein